MSDVQCDRFDDPTGQCGPDSGQRGQRWSPRRSAVFLAISSLSLWALIAWAVALVG